MILAFLCTVAQGAWAQFYVANEGALKDAIAQGHNNIKLYNDIDLSDKLVIDGSISVTIDLDGHKLDRGLSGASTMSSGVIYVKQGGSLTITDGSVNKSGKITGGYANKGGGIYNSGTLVVNGGTITGNRAGDEGGGIYNDGTLTINGGVISSNTASGNGGGIGNDNTLTIKGGTITGNSANSAGGGIWMGTGTLNMQDAITVTGNTKAGGLADNVYLASGKVITVTGSLTGSSIGISMQYAGKFTSGYSTYHSGDAPSTLFSKDHPVYNMILHDNEGCLSLDYLECSWDSEHKQVVTTTKTLYEEIGFNDTPTSDYQYKVLTADRNKLPSTGQTVSLLGTENSSYHEYYVVKDNMSATYSYYLMGPNVHIIICDNVTFHPKPVAVLKGTSFYLHAQSAGENMGRWHADENHTAGIGGMDWRHYYKYSGYEYDGGNIEIHGCDIKIEEKVDGGFSEYHFAAIGGMNNNNNITIFDGKIIARTSAKAAGIGSGSCDVDEGKINNGRTITIYGGHVEAYGGTKAAGIGGGEDAAGGTITINGGYVYAEGKDDGAGIGGGYDGNGANVTINGGTVEAHGGKYGAGIGSGMEAAFSFGLHGGTVIITGGHVEAYGGVDAAGIGGGEDADGGTVTISGGYVYAQGNSYGAGIGGGEDGDGAKVTITGGTVIAKAGDDTDGKRAIGAGKGSNTHKDLTFADNLGVFITTNLYRSQKANRVSDCQNNQYVKITKCAHGGATVSIVSGEKHDISSCKYCLITGEEAHTFGDNGQCTVCGLINLSDNASNTETISHWAGSDSHDVVLNGRTLTKNGDWNTLCLPFAVSNFTGTPLEGATVKELLTTTSNLDNGTLTLNFSDNLTAIEAGKPYIVKWENASGSVSDPVFSDVTISNTTPTAVEFTGGRFVGQYSPFTIDNDNIDEIILLSTGNKLGYANSTRTLHSFRCHFEVPTNGGGQQARSFMLDFGDGEQTGIVSMEDGRSKMEDVWYTIDGRKLQGKPTKKGLYIQNGRKVVIM